MKYRTPCINCYLKYCKDVAFCLHLSVKGPLMKNSMNMVRILARTEISYILVTCSFRAVIILIFITNFFLKEQFYFIFFSGYPFEG